LKHFVEKMSRRKFIAEIGATALMHAFADTRRVGSVSGVFRPGLRLGFQVFAVRDLCEKDLVGTLKAAKALGYEGVETGRFYGRGAVEWKTICADIGLDLFALQLYPHNLTEPQLAETIRFCHESGCTRINAAWYYGSPANPNDWQLVINVMNHAAAVCAKEGISVAYHNHDHEFRMKFDGKSVWEWLWEPSSGNGSLRQITAVPRFSPLVMQELDCGNCILGGCDPVYWLDRYPCRNPTVHVMPVLEEAGVRPGECGVGAKSDRANWLRIIGSLRRNGTEWLVVKPVSFPDSLADLKASAEYLRGLGVG